MVYIFPKNKELCDEYMGKYPVIFLSLKGVEGLDFSAKKENVMHYHRVRNK